VFVLVARRYERASLIVTSNKPFSAWGEIGDEVTAKGRDVARPTPRPQQGVSFRPAEGEPSFQLLLTQDVPRAARPRIEFADVALASSAGPSRRSASSVARRASCQALP
jgi:hypothetical protein